MLLLAKEPRAGHVKTRLCPPCTPMQAAQLATAALMDTLEVMLATGADRVVLALDGVPGPWLPHGVELVAQGCGTFDRRLAHAWSHMTGPTLQIGMDTPQITTALIRDAFRTLERADVDAVLGPAEDGGWWALGMSRPDPDALLGIPTSRHDTGALQLARLRERGHRTEMLVELADFDAWPAALSVARTAPRTRFAREIDLIASTPA